MGRLLEADRGHACQTPQSLEVIKFAVFLSEEVDYHRAEVNQDPTRIGVALATQRIEALVCKVLIENVDQGVHVPGVLRSGYDKEVAERRDLADIKQHDVFRLMLRQSIDDSVGDFGWLW